MNGGARSLLAFVRSRKGSTVEFVLIFPFLFMFLLMLIDAGNLFAQYRAAQQVAETVVRTARALDLQLDTTTAKPLSAASITILSNVAARMKTQAPEGVNYVWIGRFAMPQGAGAGTLPQQFLPDGIQGKTNQGIVLAGGISNAAAANLEAASVIGPAMTPGEMVYVADVTFSRFLLTPLPRKRLVFSVRYTL